MKFLFILLVVLSISYQTTAQFGISAKKKTKKTSDDGEIGSHYEDVDFHNDPELKAAIQNFADMSPEEMKETILALMEDIDSNDVETLKELDSILEELSKLDAEEIEEDLYSIMEEEAVAKSMAETMALLQQSGDDAWEKIISKKDLILDVVTQSGVMSEDEITLFQNNPSAWEEELKEIWNEMKAVAAASGNDEL